MLTPRVLATLRATLLFWQEEMAVHSMEIARPYWDQSEFSPLTVAEIENLRRELVSVSYVACDPQQNVLLSMQLFTAADLESLSSQAVAWAAVVLPTS